MSGDGWDAHVEFLRSPPSADGLARMVEAVFPGSAVRGWQRLPGGLGAAASVVDLRLPSGSARRVVLKRFETVRVGAVEEHRRLAVAHRHLGSAAPEPLGLDAEGRWFGGASLVMGWIDGHATLDHERADWAEQMGGAIAALHRATLTVSQVGAIPARTVGDVDPSLEIERGPGPWAAAVDVVRAACRGCSEAT